MGNTINKQGNSVLMEFIAQAADAGKSIAIFLSTGVKLQGQVAAFDEQSIKLKCSRDRTNIVVMCAHITTVSDRDNSENTDRGVF